MATPSVTDWMQGWGTVAGAVFSALALAATVGLLWHEMLVRRRDEEDRLAAQARMVLVSVLDARGDVDQGIAQMLIVNVRNHSQAPIIDVEVSASQKDGAAGGSDQFEFHIEAIEPGQSDGDLWLLQSPVTASRQTPITDQVNSRVAFTDAQGLRWQRVDRNQPQRLR
jgi:hypothetical protein